MVTTSDEKVSDTCRLLRSHGQRERYDHVMLGSNYRMTEIEAAIGLGQLSRLEEFNRRRRENAAFLTSQIAAILDVPDGFEQLLRGGALEQVSPRPGQQGIENLLTLLIDREHKHQQVRVGRFDAAEAIYPVHAGQVNVHQYHIRFQ